MPEDFNNPMQGEDDEADIIPNLRASDVRRPLSDNDSHRESSKYETDQGEDD